MASPKPRCRFDLSDELNIPAQQRIYLHGWGYHKSPPYIAQRAELFHSPEMRAASEQALAMAGVTADEIDFLDLYSCFASNVNFTRDSDHGGTAAQQSRQK